MLLLLALGGPGFAYDGCCFIRLKKPQPSAAAGAVCSFHPEILPCLNKLY